MDLYEFNIPKNEFLELKEIEQKLVIQFGHVFNELLCLKKLLQSVIDLDTEGLERQAMLQQSLIVSRLLVGKLHEAHLMIGRNYNQDKLKETVLAERSEAKKVLDRYFGKNNLFAKIRDNFSFHYDSDYLSNPSERIGNDGFTGYISENNHNSFYFSSEIATIDAIQTFIGKPNLQENLNQYFSDLRNVSDNLLTYLRDSIEKVLAQLSLDKLNQKQHQIQPQKKLGEVKLPFFVKE